MDHPFNSMIGKFICHFDADSFYCACECIRRPELKKKPFAVTQFNSGGFVSVNNIARLAGVRKGDGIGAGGQKALDHFKNRPDALMGEVLKRCPDLIVLPMDTIWYRQVSSNIENALKLAIKKEFLSSSASSFTTSITTANDGNNNNNNNYNNDGYNNNKKKNNNNNNYGVVEKSSIDDYFVDITNLVLNNLLHNKTNYNNNNNNSNISYYQYCSSNNNNNNNHDVLKHHTISNLTKKNTWIYLFDDDKAAFNRIQNERIFSSLPIHLQCAAEIASKLRKYVEETVGVTLSGGISKNKLISRLISKIKHQTNVQTIIENKNVEYLLKCTKIKSVHGLKAQFGNRLINDFNVEFLSDLRKIKYNTLEQKYGKNKANLIYEYSRGQDSSNVVNRPPIKSLLSEQSFAPIDMIKQNNILQQKVNELVSLFIDRLLLLENRIPTLFIIKFRHLYDQIISKSKPFPKLHLFKIKNGNKKDDNDSNECKKYDTDDRSKDRQRLFDIIYQILNNFGNKKLKLSRLALIAGNFQEMNTNQKSIIQMFKKKPNAITTLKKKIIETNNIVRRKVHNVQNYYKCQLCDKMIHIDKKQEHEDFHYALNVSKLEERNNEHYKKKKRKNGNNNDIRNWVIKKKKRRGRGLEERK